MSRTFKKNSKYHKRVSAYVKKRQISNKRKSSRFLVNSDITSLSL